MIGGPDELEQESVVEETSPDAQESPVKEEPETQVKEFNVSDDEDEDEQEETQP